ncbi:MAG: SIMPL domain-containing protein [Anaerolineae bacterium]
MLKRVLLVVAAIALLVPVGLAGVWAWGHVTSAAIAQTSETTADYNTAQTITVVGRGSVRIEPDIAQVSIGVETSAETIAEAVAENETQMKAILTALEEANIAEKDIQTMNFSIHMDRYPEPMPRSVEEGSEPQPQYRVSNMVNVTIRDLDAVGDVLEVVIEAGANNIWGLSFGLDDQEAAQVDARADAIADAKDRAEALAELSGVELGPVMSVSEVISGGAVPMPVEVAERAMAGGGSISPGELEIGYQVQVTYFIER